MKSVLINLHRWLGLTLGLLFAFICVLGSALLFQAQFFRWAHGDLIPQGMSSEVGSIETWIMNANAAVPNLGAPLYVWSPHVSHNISDAGMLLYRDQPGGWGRLGLTAVLVAPASGEVLGVVSVDRSLAYAPIFLHGRLMSGSTGLTIVAVIAVGSLLLLIIGAYLWLPPRRFLVKKLSVRPWRNTFLYAGRLHDWAGAWSLVLMLMVATTGIYMARAQWLAPVLQLLPGASHHEAAGHVAAGSCAAPIGMDAAIGVAQALVPGASLVEMKAMKRGDAGSWRLAFQPEGTPAESQQTHIAVDLACGKVALVSSPEQRAPRDTTEMWLHGLHDGTVFGLPGQILISVIGLLPVLLLWTGTVRWWKSRRRNQQLAGAIPARAP